MLSGKLIRTTSLISTVFSPLKNLTGFPEDFFIESYTELLQGLGILMVS